MDVITLEAKPRPVGARTARTLRRNGQVPCILYGHNVEPVAFAVPELALRPLVHTDEFHQVEVRLDGKTWRCIMKAIDFHPVTDRPVHADFQVLQAGEKVTVTVPIQFHGTPKGQKDGGVPRAILHEVEIVCLPEDIPSHIDVDVSGLGIGDVLHIGDLDMPGIEFHTAPEQTIYLVTAPRVVAEGAAEEEGLGVPGEEAAEDETPEAAPDEEEE
ncbi:MAG: hypothetical protein KatS3mg043_0964 [Rhodothermaceae bacterium]|nr:MAG: hypothetical protein KatS3mg043_0964 [Rhodothermaceae bacterium]